MKEYKLTWLKTCVCSAIVSAETEHEAVQHFIEKKYGDVEETEETRHLYSAHKVEV